MSSDADGLSLKDRFAQVAEGCERLESGGPSPSPSASGGKGEADLKGNILTCMRMVDALALFSDNEDKDDIPTYSLRYILLPYYLGVVHMNLAGPGNDRLPSLEESVLCFRSFVRQCNDKGLLEDGVRSFVGRLEDGATFTFGREEKIALYRRQKEVKQAMEALGRLEEDEENVRSTSLLQINSCAMSAYQHYGALQKEIELLKFAKQRESEMGTAGRGGAAEGGRNREREREPSGINGNKVNGIFTIYPRALDRERLAQGVFKQSHTPYTMTVEEFGEMELQRLREREREASAKAGAESSSGKCCSDDDHSEDEECLKKAREWDDFKDDNPFGWGNKGNRPCG